MNTKISMITALSFSALLAIGCKGDDKKDGESGTKTAKKSEAKPAAKKPAAPAKPIELTGTADIGAAISDVDDTRYKGISLKVPAGATASDHDGMGLTVIYNEKQFEIRFEFEDEGAVAKGKAEATADDFDPLVKFHVDQADAILWESSSKLGGDNNFHFVATVKVGEKNLLCKNKGYGSFTKVEAEALLKSCQSATKK